jgi:endogenous inhibitor of DNA gyrase (YacG/DUF329 family)
MISGLERPIATDPPVRTDGKCVVCGKARKITKQTWKYAKGAADVDPFCSTRCARIYYDTPLADKPTGRPKVLA